MGADDYRLQPRAQSPLASFDHDVNEREELLVHEDLFHSSNIGIELGFPGLNKDNITKNETTIAKLTKRLGEVDYTEAESNILQAFSANRNREINPNDTFKSHSKRQLLISLQEFGLDKAFDYGRCQYLRSLCTGVLYPLSRLL